MEPGNQTQKIYGFQRQFFYGELLLLFFSGALVILTWLPPIYSYAVYGFVYAPALRAAIFLNITFGSIFLLFLFVKKGLRNTQFVVSEDRLIKKTPYRITTLRYKEISGLELERIFLKKLIRISAPDGFLRIPFFIENATAFVGDLVEALRRDGSIKNINPREIEAIRIRALLSDASRGRAVRAFYPLVGSMLLCIGFNLIVANAIWHMSPLAILVWGFCGIFFPLLAFLLSNFSISSQLENAITSPEAAVMPDEPQTYIQSGFAVFIIYLVAGILYKSFML